MKKGVVIAERKTFYFLLTAKQKCGEMKGIVTILAFQKIKTSKVEIEEA